MCCKKPPLGIIPKDIYMKKRFQDLCEAIVRYWNTGYQIPIEWIEEYNELIRSGYSLDIKERSY